MQTKFTWKKDFFSALYRIYSNGHEIGKLKEKTFTQTAIGELNGKEYTFRQKGFLKPQTEIINNNDHRVIGEITFSNWMTKASLSIDNKVISWKYDNIWNTKWSLFDSEGIKIQYAGSSTSGQIDSNIDDGLLLLSGLYVTNYYWQMTLIILVAVLVPIFASVSG